MKRKIIILISIIIILVGGVLIYRAIQDQEPAYQFVVVERGDISQEVSETGLVAPAQSIDLDFQIQGRVASMSVKAGDKVKLGQELVKLDQSELSLLVSEARAALEVAQAKLDKTLAGASQEDIQVYQTAVDKAEVTLANEKQTLADVQTDAASDLDQAYEDALDDLKVAYTKADQALLIVYVDMRKEYFNDTSQLSLDVKQKENTAKTSLAQAKTALDQAETTEAEKDIDTALIKLSSVLTKIREALAYLRQAMDDPLVKTKVSATDRTSVNTERTNIDTEITNLTAAKQNIATTKITNQTNINDAQADVKTAETNLKKAQDDLVLKKASPQEADLALAQAQVRQAQASLSLAQERFSQTILRSPIKGIVTQVDIEVGEMTKVGQSVISLESLGQYQIEADIYEEDIVKVKIGQPVDIVLVAFPDKILKGRLAEIEPVEKLIEGVVYYKVTIDFEESKEGLKPGMTADIVIRTAWRENVLIIPEGVIQKKDGWTTVQVFEEGLIREQAIEIGLKGSDNMREVLGGLEQGEKVIVE